MKRDDTEDPKPQEPEQELAGWIYHVPILLRKYGSHLMLGLSLLLLAYVGWKKYEENKVAKENEAWVQLADATKQLSSSADNPTSGLRTVANTADQPAVRASAYLILGQYYLDSVIKGHGDTDEAINQAQAAFEKVVNELKDETPFVLNARLGLAQVAEDKAIKSHDWDAAAALYKSIAADADSQGYPIFSTFAKSRLDNLALLKEPIVFAPAQPPASAPSSLPFSIPGLGGPGSPGMNFDPGAFGPK